MAWRTRREGRERLREREGRGVSTSDDSPSRTGARLGRVRQQKVGREREQDGEETLLYARQDTIQRRVERATRTRMKSHAQPGRPPTPSILMIPAARRPEKADASDVAENMIEMLHCKIT